MVYLEEHGDVKVGDNLVLINKEKLRESYKELHEFPYKIFAIKKTIKYGIELEINSMINNREYLLSYEMLKKMIYEEIIEIANK